MLPRLLCCQKNIVIGRLYHYMAVSQNYRRPKFRCLIYLKVKLINNFRPRSENGIPLILDYRFSTHMAHLCQTAWLRSVRRMMNHPIYSITASWYLSKNSNRAIYVSVWTKEMIRPFTGSARTATWSITRQRINLA